MIHPFAAKEDPSVSLIPDNSNSNPVLMTEIPKEEYVNKCTSACAGCSSSLILRYVLKASGPDTVLVVPACCTSVIQGTYPNTAINVPVYNIAFAASAACASGMSAAFRKAGKRTNVIVYAGDGGTVDIGIQSLSGAFERKADLLYICYDNETYGNTGMQRSGSTPAGAMTTTTPGGKVGVKKDIDRIVEAHDPPYLATACSAFPQDLYRKVKKALAIRGPKFIHILAPCPPGWGYPSGKTIEIGKLAVKTGIWILYEREYGQVTVSSPSRSAMTEPAPLEAYLSAQWRFRRIDADAVAVLRSQIERNLRRLALQEKGTC